MLNSSRVHKWKLKENNLKSGNQTFMQRVWFPSFFIFRYPLNFRILYGIIEIDLKEELDLWAYILIRVIMDLQK